MYFVNEQWQSLLQANQCDNFEKLWQINASWTEEPNQRRGGWSGVNSFDLKSLDSSTRVFLKKQSNHTCRTYLHPFNGIPTFRREINNIIRFNQQGIDTLQPLFYAERKHEGAWQAVLLTKALDNYISLESLLDGGYLTKKSCEIKYDTIKKIAIFIRNVHDKGFRYGCLYPKHIFVLQNNQAGVEHICLIDLEKARKSFFAKNRMFRDLSTFYRMTKHISTKDSLRFIKYYLGVDKLRNKDKHLVKLLIKRIQRKAGKS